MSVALRAAPSTRHGLIDSARRIAPLAWPVLVGQLAVLAFSTIDTVMVARYAALDLAALAIGGAVYISVFVGFMGVVLAIGPIAGQLFGAGRLPGHAEQAGGVGLGLSLVKQIAERHGGSVRCEARRDGGSCFVLSLPLA